MSGIVLGDGLTFESGLRIDGKHCRRCGSPSDARDTYAYTDSGTGYVDRQATTSCCGEGVCYGYVCVEDWVGKADSSRSVWACHRELADQHLGEATWARSVPSRGWRSS